MKLFTGLLARLPESLTVGFEESSSESSEVCSTAESAARQAEHSAARKSVKASFCALMSLCLALTLCCGLVGCDDDESSLGVTTTSRSASFSSDAVRSRLTDPSTAESVTVMVYMNGSNLETDDGSATEDISEMLDANYSDNVNVVVQTMGTKDWQNYGISSTHSQRYLLQEDSLLLVDDSLTQLDCTASSTLYDFITWSAANYTADRYILLFWDHGGGSVYGFGYDEFQDDDAALTIDEIQLALSTSGVLFDFIGFDACIMSCMEVCCAFYDYCDYMVLSEEFESGIGWSYEGWLNALAENPAIDTEELGKIIVDDMVSTNTTSSDGDTATLALIDQAMMKVLFTAWTDFAYANEDTLLGNNYSQEVTKSSRALARLNGSRADDDYSLSSYYLTDIMAVAQNVDSDESDTLSSAVSNTIVYFAATSDVSSLTGMSVTLPYGDDDFYQELVSIFTNCGFDSDYITWLEAFTSAEGSSDYYDYDDEWSDWFGWDDYDDDYDWTSWLYDYDDDYWSSAYDWDDWNYYDYWDSDSYDDFWDGEDYDFWDDYDWDDDWDDDDW